MHPAYAEALQSAPEFEWALARVRSFVQDVEWDPRPMAHAPRLNPDGSFFNKWTQGTLIDVGLSMEDFVRDSLSLQQPFASFAGVAPSVRRLIGRIAAQGKGIAAARADTAAAMIDVAWRLVPLSSRLVDQFMPRHALTVAGHLNVAFLEVVSRAIE